MHLKYLMVFMCPHARNGSQIHHRGPKPCTSFRRPFAGLAGLVHWKQFVCHWVVLHVSPCWPSCSVAAGERLQGATVFAHSNTYNWL